MGLTESDVARRAQVMGRGTEAVYIRHIELGMRRPSYDLARALSAMTSDGTGSPIVSVAEFMAWAPPGGHKPKARAEAAK